MTAARDRAQGTQNAPLDKLIDLLERWEIHGRGGAGFPTATKLRAVARQRRTPIVVVNASEGEPLSVKDRYLLSARADTVLDGALAAARALRADQIVIAVDELLRSEREQVTHAIRQRSELSRNGLSTVVRSVPSGYVTGQETALVASLSGRPPKPTLVPPYPFQQGLQGRPTLVSNTETYSHIGRVTAGTYDGTRLVTVGGAVAQPGLVEITSQTTLAALVEAAGGITERISGVLLGGYGGTWASWKQSHTQTLGDRALREQGLTLGAGIVFLLGDSHCPVGEVSRVARWMAGQSADQCGPCIHGLAAIADALSQLTRRGDQFGTYPRIRQWAQMVTRRGACAHPDGVARFVTTALAVFKDEFQEHARLGGCGACTSTGVLPTRQLRPWTR